MNDAAHTATRDPDLTRARILEAAFDLFVESGYADVSMRQIAARSGVTKSLIHHHFGTKEALWEAVKHQAFEAYAQSQIQTLEKDRDSQTLLSDAIINYFNFLKEHPEVVRLFAWTHLEGDVSCGELDRRLVETGAARIREAQEAGRLRADVNPTHVVTIFVNVCTQWFEAKTHHQDWPGMGSDEEFLDDFIKTFMEGLQPRK